jgi:hypothetical protein
MKGYTTEELGRIVHAKWSRFSKPVAVGFDASRFDQHVSKEALQWEHSIYNRLFGCKRLAKLLSWQVGDRGKARCPDGVIHYQRTGGRASGDMNTSLGNCLITCGLFWEFRRRYGLDFELINNGDDCVIICEESRSHLLELVPDFFLTYGFTMVVEPTVHHLEQVVFCQMQPIYDGRVWLMVRQLSALDKDQACVQDIRSEKQFRKWISAVGVCGLHLTAGIPVFQAFYKSLIIDPDVGGVMNSPQFAQGGLYYWYRAKCSSPTPPVELHVSDEARVSFWRAFGLTPDEQVALEEWYANHPPMHSELRPFRGARDVPRLF